MARRKSLTRTGLPQFLSSTLRTVKLKELAANRGRRLNILRKFIEKILFSDDPDYDSGKQKLSIEEFAQMIDLKAGTWSRLERAESCLSLEAADWISSQVLKKFGVFATSDWLLGDIEGHEDYPRKINQENFDIYGYLKDLYKAHEINQKLSDTERAQLKDIYMELASNKEIVDIKGFQKIITKYEKELLIDTEKAQLADALKKAAANKNKVIGADYHFLQMILRRLVVSSDLSNEDKSVRLVLASYFMSDVFTRIQPDSLITYVRDNQMNPIFYKGETIGGIKVSLNNLRVFDKMECIIEFTNSIKVVRILHYVSSTTVILATTSNENSPEIVPISDILSIALVTFRYKNLERNSINLNNIYDDQNPSLIRFEDIKKL